MKTFVRAFENVFASEPLRLAIHRNVKFLTVSWDTSFQVGLRDEDLQPVITLRHCP